MPHFTVDQIKQTATHLRQESIRLRRSNPELSAIAHRDANVLTKIAERREKQDHLARSPNEAHDHAQFDTRADETARGTPPTRIDPAAQ
jgi:hypothetical protein